jgi:hypothetical protein
MADGDRAEIEALVLENVQQRSAELIRGQGVTGDRHAGGLGRPRRGPGTALQAGADRESLRAVVQPVLLIPGDLDDARPDGAALDAVLNLPDKVRGDIIDRPPQEIHGNPAVNAGGADDIHAGVGLGDLLEERYLPAQVKRREVDHADDARVPGPAEGLEVSLDRIVLVVYPGKALHSRAAGRQVLVRERPAQAARIDRTANSLNACHGALLRSRCANVARGVTQAAA